MIFGYISYTTVDRMASAQGPEFDENVCCGGAATDAAATAAAPKCDSPECPGTREGSALVLWYNFDNKPWKHCLDCLPGVQGGTHIFAALTTVSRHNIMLTTHITELEHELVQQQARHTEQRNAAIRYHQTNVDNCRKVNDAKRLMDSQSAQRQALQAQREEQLNAQHERLNAQQERLLALQRELQNHAAVHPVP